MGSSELNTQTQSTQFSRLRLSWLQGASGGWVGGDEMSASPVFVLISKCICVCVCVWRRWWSPDPIILNLIWRSYFLWRGPQTRSRGWWVVVGGGQVWREGEESGEDWWGGKSDSSECGVVFHHSRHTIAERHTCCTLDCTQIRAEIRLRWDSSYRCVFVCVCVCVWRMQKGL